MPRRRISNRTPRELTPAERKVVSDVVLERDSDFRVKTGSVSNPLLYTPDPGVFVLSEQDGKMYYANQHGWYQQGADTSPIILYVEYDGVTQFDFKFKAPSTSTLDIYDGDGTMTPVVGQDSTLITHTTNYATAGTYYFYVEGDYLDITRIDVRFQLFVSGDVSRFSELVNIDTLALESLMVTGDVTEMCANGIGYSTLVLIDLPNITGDVSKVENVGVLSVINCPNTRFLDSTSIIVAGSKQITLTLNGWPSDDVNTAIAAFKDMVDGKVSLFGNESRTIISNTNLLSMIGNGNLVSVPEDSVMLDLDSELHTGPNAASDPNGNEADAITGWVATGLNGVGNNYFISTSQQKSEGNYSFKTSSNDTPTSGANIKLTLAVNDASIYRFAFNVRHTEEGARWAVYVDGIYVGYTIDPYVVSFQKMATYYTTSSISTDVEFREASPTNDGGLYVDNVSLRKVTLP